ncbi:MAG TPA: helix-turn-helix domain-containing protein [Pyrinomonadaceae bacterium]|jgi:tetratricopeptide (TPR) repeat protein
MTLAEQRLKELDNPSLTSDERALLRCGLATELIQEGQYETACQSLGKFWRGVGERPDLKGLPEEIAAEVLLRVGVLSGWIGACRQLQGAQESAKDLISESAALFESIRLPERVAVARCKLALCYWREGAYDEARVLLTDAFQWLIETAERAEAIVKLAIVECSAGRHCDALVLLKEHAHFFDERVSHALRGSFHNQLALVLKQLGILEGRSDYLDRAIIEYTAAIYHVGKAGNDRYRAVGENNLANLLHKMGRHRQAHEHLDRAGAVLRRLDDAGLIAQVDETRASVFIAEKKYKEAERVITRAVKALEHGGAAALLAESLTTQGVVLARLGNVEASVNVLRRAVRAAEEGGAFSNAGLAALTLIEEHGARRTFPQTDLYELYQRAGRLLRDTQHPETIVRQLACAQIVMRRLAGVRPDDKNFTFFSAVQEFEEKLIEWALEEAQGSVVRAARLLGLKHQTFSSMLNQRHKKFLEKRSPLVKRLRSIIKEPKG